jgi:tRNA A-37 threonylcarbamoyl transferase component Bud32
MDVLSFMKPADKPGLLGKLDHYEVIEIVGKGGMGVVLKAFDPKLHRLVALKLMAPHLAAHGGARKRFEREAKAVAAVRNEHVVAIHGVETDGSVPYLVMEFVGGVSLQDRLDRRGPAEVKEVLRIGMQAAHGLAAAHKVGIIHRDIKPANILLENGVERVKITDFGLARAADDANLTQSGVITGTPNYMSPEQAAGIVTDARSDLFSLGSVLYALCTGHPPFRAETPLAVLRRVCDDPVRPPREANPDVPDWLDAIVRKLLAKNPADRFQSATDVAELLGQHLAHLQQPAAVPMPATVAVPAAGERVWRQIFEATDRDRRLWQHGMIATGLVLIGLAAAVGIPSGSYLILFAPAVIGLALIAVGGFERQQWDVPYKGRTIRFENSPFAGERLFVDGVRIATGGFGFLRELRGTIPDGPGAGDEVRALCEAGFLSFKCRISVSEGGPRPPAPLAAPVVPAGSPIGTGERHTGAGVGCLLAPLALVGLLLFRDTIYRFYKSEYFAPIDMGISLWFGWLFIRFGRRKATSRANRWLWDAALGVLVAGTAVGLVLWGRDLGREGPPQWKDWHFAALLLALVIGEMALVPWLVARRRARLAATATDGPPPSEPPPAPPPGPTGVAWLIVIGIVAFPALLFWTHESFWEGYFRPGYVAPVYMIVSSGLLLAVLWWCRRQSEPAWYRRALGVAMAAVIGGTLVGLLMSWGEGSYLDKLGGASSWQNGGIFVALAIILVSVAIRVIRWVATDERSWSNPPPDAGSPPGVDLLTILVLMIGSAALAVGFVTSKINGDPNLQVPAREQWRLLAGWAGFALLCFGPLALLSRWYWRRRSPAHAGRGGWVMVAAALGLVATLAGVSFVVRLSPALRGELPGQAEPTDDAGYLRVVKEDPDAEVIVERPGDRLVQGSPGGQSVHGVRVQADTAYTLSIRKGAEEVHHGVVRLKAGERREIHIPPIALADRAVRLVPRKGSFPSDVTRMEISPDRSVVAVERFDGPILVFDAATGRERFTVEREKTHCTAFGFTPDGKRLAYLTPAGPVAHVLRVVDVTDGHQVEKDLTPPPGQEFSNSHALAFSPDGKRLAVSAAYNTGPDNRWESRVYRWELAPGGAGLPEAEFPETLTGMIKALRFSGDGTEVLAVSGTDVAMGWGWQTGHEDFRYHADLLEMDLLATAHDRVIAAGRNRDLGRAFVAQIHPTPPPPPPEFGPVAYASLSVSPDGGLLAAGTKGAVNVSWDQVAAVHVWDATTGKQRAILVGHADWPLAIAFEPDGKRVLTASKDGTARHWKLP